MAYNMQYYADLIDKLNQTDPAQAFAVYNGLSQANLGGGAGGIQGAIRSKWGVDKGAQWVNQQDARHMNTAQFDPRTGKYSYHKDDGTWAEGTVAGFDPRQFDADIQMVGGGWMPTAEANARKKGTYSAAPVGWDDPRNAGYGINGSRMPTDYVNNTFQTGTGQGGDMRMPMGGFGPLPSGGSGNRGINPGGMFSNNMVRGGGTQPSLTGTPTPFGGAAGARAGGGAPPFTPAGGNGSDGEFTQANGATVSPLVAAIIQSMQRDPSAGNPFDFMNDEGYKFRLKSSQDALENSAAARGQLGSGATLKALQENAQGLASQEYDKAYGRYDQNRKFLEDQYRYTNDDSYKRQLQNLLFNNENYWKSADFNNNNYWKSLGFNEDQRRDSRDFDWRKYTNERDYNTNLDKWEKEFGYNAESKDRDRNMTTLMELVRSGLLGTQGSGNLAGELARIWSQLNMEGAGAGAAGTRGGANDIMNILNQILRYYGNQSLIPQP